MPVNQTTRERIEMVKDEIKKGVPRHFILKKLSPVFHIAPRSIDRIIGNANCELAEEERVRKEIRDAARREEMTIVSKEQIMNDIELEARLSLMIAEQEAKERE